MHSPLPFAAYLQVRAATGGALSPDGRSLAFLLNDSGCAQLYRQDGPDALPRRLTESGETVRSAHWSPSGSRLLFAMDAGGSEREQLYLIEPDRSEPRLLTDHPGAIHTFGAWAPDSRRIAYAANRRNPQFFDLYLLDTVSGEERPVLTRDSYWSVLCWLPDGRRLVVREHLGSYQQTLALLDTELGEVTPLLAGDRDGRFPWAAALPEGEDLLLLTDRDRDFLALCRLHLRTGELDPVLEEAADVEQCDLSRSGRRWAALVNRDGWSELVQGEFRPDGVGALQRQALGGVATACRLSADGKRLAVTRNGPRANSNVWVGEWGDAEWVRWTQASMGEVAPEDLVEPELIRYPSHDGLAIPAFLYRPRGATASPLPVVVHVHGGPESQERPNYSATYQFLAGRGYAVLAPNVRGSAGYGNQYCHLDDVEKRPDALRDVEYAWRWLVEQGIGDPERIAVMGASYGGFTVLYCLTHQAHLWAAGVDIVGIASFETFFRHTGPWRRHLRASEYGDPVRDAELLRTLSPIHRVEAIRAPLLVIQGANDPRVPQEESDQMVAALRARSHPVEYFLFPDEGHGIVKIPNRIVAFTAVGEFLDRYLSRGGQG